MKKFLLLSGLALLSVSAWGEGYIRTVAPDLAVTHISPNGRYVVSQVYGYVEIFDLHTGTKHDYYGNEDEGTEYTFGMGNAMSDQGIGVGSTTINGNACVWNNGEWVGLPVPNPAMTNMAQGITPDASRICGQVGNAAMTEISEIISVPCVWNRQEDGTYADPVLLPHPDKDFTGRAPQYITAVAISDDGHTIAGQIRDYSGMMTQPIIYRENENGEWSYEIPFPELANPDGVELPPDPGEAPQNAPNMRDYLTPEELQAYEDALAAWEAAGGTDWANQPYMDNFMTPEELDAFYDDVAAYYAEVEEWNKLFEPFQAALQKILEKATVFLFNNVYLSPDGKYYASTTLESVEDESSWSGFANVYQPVLMDLETKTFTPLKGENGMIVTCITSDYTVLANTDGLAKPKQAYIALEGKEPWVRLDKWLDTEDPEVGKWFTENTTHDVEIIVDEMLEIEEDYVCSGVAVCNPDMSLFATFAEVVWESTTAVYTESYIFSVNVPDIDNVELIDSDSEVLETVYYSLDGVRLAEAPAKGLVVKQTRYADGTVRTQKIAK